MACPLRIFAKAPRPGIVKTRLAVDLGSGPAARLHERMVDHLLDRAEKEFRQEFACELHTDIPTNAWQAHEVPRILQVEGDLGERMLAALPGMILGGDVPTVPLTHLVALRDALSDIALGPAEDGGFYAIHARRIHPDMFANVVWSSPETLRQTIAACERCGLSTWLGPAWRDVDDLDSPDLALFL